MSGLYRCYAKRLEKEVVNGDRPNHIAIVLDGNRRWAKRNLVMQKQGHFMGADTVENLLDWCEEYDIKIITLYVLSAENLDRKNEELDYIYDLIKTRLEKLYNDPRIHKNEMRVKAIGRIELLPDSINAVLSRLDNATKDFSNHFLNIAIAYGGQNALVDAVRKIGTKIKDQSLTNNQLFTLSASNQVIQTTSGIVGSGRAFPFSLVIRSMNSCETSSARVIAIVFPSIIFFSIQ